MKIKLGSGSPKQNHTKTRDQEEAFKEICKAIAAGETYLLAGYAGTGKSFLCQELYNRYPDAAFTAPTNKAAKVLTNDMDVPASTIHSYMGLALKRGKLEQAKRPEYNHKAVVIDECSMIDSKLYDMIQEQLAHRCAIIFIGDPFQLPPVKEPISRTFDTEKHSMLEEIVRQSKDNPIIQYSIQLRSDEGFRRTRIPFDGEYIVQAPYMSRDAWLELLIDNYKDGGVYAAWTNATVNDANFSIHRALYNDPDGKGMDFCEGERIVLNAPWLNRKMQILGNTGDEYTVKNIIPAKVHGYLVYVIDVGRTDGEEMLVISSRDSMKFKEDLEQLAAKKDWVGYYTLKERYVDVSHTYAFTCHKLQGSTYNNVVIATDDILKNRNTDEMNRCMYVAITRTRNKVIFI